MDNKGVIEKSVTVRAPRAVVFEALTKAETLTRWFPSSAQSDPRPGGRLALGWEFAKAEQNGTQSTQYVDVSADERVSYAWNGGTGAEHTLVTFDLSGGEDETVVKLQHGGWPVGDAGKPLIERHDMPWTFYMGNLKAYLEKGVDERAAALGQVVKG
jgi:uncharacterized protein YndB with AHSA1/START domain